MRLWKKVSDALKDVNSLFIASLASRSAHRNPDIEAAVIKATSHNDSHIDFYRAQRIFAWIRISGDYLRPVMSALSTRMERTHSWTVALKGLMLLHGVFSCKVPAVYRIGRLPFDLSNFKERNPDKCHHESFIRAYYTYLNEKSSFMFQHSQEQKDGRIKKGKDSNETKEKRKQSSMMQDLLWLESLQCLLDLLLKIRPQGDKMMNVLILEAMDCIVIEIFDIYSRICNGIAAILVKIYFVGKAEASMALSVLKKAAAQAKDLSQYIQFCRDFGVMKAAECPKIVHIRDEDIRDLEHIVNKAMDKPRSKRRVLSVDAADNNNNNNNKIDEQKDQTRI